MVQAMLATINIIIIIIIIMYSFSSFCVMVGTVLQYH